MLSKMARPTENTNKHTEIGTKDLSKAKLPELKQYAKDLNLKISGTKPMLKARIEECLVQTRNVLKIQRNARKYLVTKWFKMKGSTAGCVNDTDFYTLEPLNEIPYLYYFRHVDGAHSYGFNIRSLCNLALKNNGKFLNPYNRENLKQAEQKIADVVKLTNLILPGNQLMKDILAMNDGFSQPCAILSLIQVRRPLAMNPFAFKLRALDRMTIDERAMALFMHMDSLGNYTQISWFNELTHQKMYFMVARLHQLWHHVPRDLRARVCPHMSPFSDTVFTVPLTEITLAIVLRMAEIFVYSGVDPEHQNLGAMYFLTGLTLVNLNARAQLPWLYDNYFTMVN